MESSRFTSGPILKPLLRFTVPFMLSALLQAAYGAVDTLIVSNFSGNEDVAAVGTASIIMVFITNFVMGLATGMTVVVGNRIGAGDRKGASRCVGSSACFFITIALAVTFILFFSLDWLTGIMRILPEVIAPFRRYMLITAVGMVFIVSYNIVSAIFNSTGDSKTPLKCVGIACVLNIIGDYILVRYFGMGASGVAVATVCSQAVSVLFGLLFLRKQTILIVSEIRFRFDRKDNLEVLRIGFPIGFQASLITLTVLYGNSVINSFGKLEMSSASAIATRIVGFACIPYKSFSNSLSAFISHNIGAGRPDRAKKALLCGIVSSACICSVIFVVCFFAGTAVAGLFTADPEVAVQSAAYLKGFSTDAFLGSVMFCFTGYFNGLKKSYFVMFQCLFGAFAVRVPLTFYVGTLASHQMFVFGLIIPAASLVGSVIYLIYYKYLEKKESKAV